MSNNTAHKSTLVIALTSILMITGCEQTNQGTASADIDSDTPQSISVMMNAKSDSTVTGQVNFKEVDQEVSMTASFTGLEPGTHAIHIHAKADCNTTDAKSAGGHWNPTNEQHGQLGETDEYHKGDIGNFEADENGDGDVSIQTSQWCIGCDDATKNILGKSVIVHKGADDFVSQPSGNAGARVACGEITQ